VEENTGTRDEKVVDDMDGNEKVSRTRGVACRSSLQKARPTARLTITGTRWRSASSVPVNKTQNITAKQQTSRHSSLVRFMTSV